MILEYNYKYFNYQNFIEREDLIVVHDRNFYINVSAWYSSSQQVLDILNSEEFQTVLYCHNLKFGGGQFRNWHYFKGSVLLVHPILSLFFIPKQNIILRNKIFYHTDYKSDRYYEQVFRNFPKNIMEFSSYYRNSWVFGKSKVVYEVPKFEAQVILYLRDNLQAYSWATLDINLAFFCFRAKSDKYTKSVLYFGSIKNSGIKLSEKIAELHEFFVDMKLLSVVKFYDDVALNDFETSFITILSKKNNLKEHPNFDLKILDASNRSFSYALHWQYYTNSHLCSICSPTSIDLLNQNWKKVFKLKE